MTSLAMPYHVDSTETSTGFRFPWLQAIVLVFAYFMFQHDVKVSTYVLFIPEKEAIGAESGLVRSGRSLGLLFIAALGAISLAGPTRFRLQPRFNLVLPMLLVAGWTVVCLLCSPGFAFTLKQLVMITLCLIGAAGLARRCSLSEITALAVFAMTTYVVIGIVIEIALGTFKPTSPDHRLAGTVHPNTQSFQCAIICLGSLSLMRRNGKFSMMMFLLLGFGLLAMLLTRSRGGLLAVLLSMGVNWFVTSSPMAKFLTMLTTCFAASMLGMVLLLNGADVAERFDSAKSMGRADGEDTHSFSGRLPLWNELLNQVGQRPITGFGYGTFWSLPQVESVRAKAGWDAPDAHSMYVEAMLNWGIPGLAFVIWTITAAFRSSTQLFQKTGDAGAAFFASFLFFGVVNGISEAVFMGPAFSTFLAAACYFHLAYWTPESEPVST